MLPELQESSQGLSVVYLRARFRGLGFTWEFPKIRGTLFGVLIIRIRRARGAGTSNTAYQRLTFG